MPAVSVIVPAFNVEPYLGESIESALGQTYRDFEVIVVNDGSADATGSVAERYAADHPGRVIALSQPNRGVSAARNAALAIARGSRIALLDGDDRWAPAFLESQMRILDARPEIAIVTGNAVNLGGPSDGAPVRPVDPSQTEPELVDILRDETAVFIMSLFRREVVNAVGGFDERFRTNEDYDFWIRAAQAGFRFVRNPTPLGFYRRHAPSLSASDIRMLTGIVKVYMKALPHCAPDSPEWAVIEGQVARFEMERVAAEARLALEQRNIAAALASVRQLQRRRPSVGLAAFAWLLRLMPAAALALYRARRRMLLAPRPGAGAVRPATAASV